MPPKKSKALAAPAPPTHTKRGRPPAAAAVEEPTPKKTKAGKAAKEVDTATPNTDFEQGIEIGRGQCGDNEDLRNGFLDLLKTGVTQDVEDEANIQPHEIGAKIEVQLLYAGRAAYCSCCKVWDDEKPVDHADAHLRQLSEKQRQRFAILRRQDRHGRGTWKTHSIVINSKLIRERLTDVFRDYPNVDPHAVELSFTPPFLSFVHRWERLMHTLKEETDETARKHLTLLVDLLSPETEGLFKNLRNIQDTGYVTFDDLTLVYIFGEIVVQSFGGVVSAGILRDVSLTKELGIPAYVFTVDVVDWNGETFGVKKEQWALFEYKGSQRLTELSVLPLRSHPDLESITKDLIARGRIFRRLAGYHFRSYSGKASILQKVLDKPYQPPVKSYIPISERVIVDTYMYYSLQDQIPPELRPLEELKRSSKKLPGSSGHMDEYDTNLIRPLYEPRLPTNYQPLSNEDFSAAVSTFQVPEIQDHGDSLDKLAPLSDEQCLLAVGWVKGFATHSKLWCEVEVSRIQDVGWKTTALQNLVLGDNEKRLLTAIIASQIKQKDATFDDFIDGKGKGVIILLSGPPGVGKTLTAESVAEHLKRPLYRLGAADLGSTIATVEARLSDTLIRCAAWNAVLLIDEADVFLEARTTDSLERNELISIFLRLLEYYTGVLVLTTNRISCIDTAFESRIDISLHYSDLTAAARAQVLSNFLQTLPPNTVSINESDIEDLVKIELNGRQIKSAVKMARILADSEGVRLGKAHLEVVLGLREKAKKLLAGEEGRD